MNIGSKVEPLRPAISAEQIQKHPLDPFGFSINWFGTPRPMTEEFQNPPLTERRTIDRDVGAPVAVEIAAHGNVSVLTELDKVGNIAA